MSDTEDHHETHEQTQNLPAVQQEDRPQRVPILAGGPVRAIVPQDFDGAYRVAVMAVRGGLNVRGLETVEKCMVAIMHGMEVGLTPMAAIQSIAVINGRPTIYGDGAMGLVLAAPVCDWVEETAIGAYPNDDYKAICRVKRKGSPKIITGEFSVADAKQAGLWDTRARVKRFKKGGQDSYEIANDSPWYKYPKRMLKMRARWALRDGFADVLKGLHLREEVEDMEAEPTPAERPARRAPPPPDEVKQEVVSHPDNGEAEDRERAEQAKETIEGDFPGDKPARRAPPPPEDNFDIEASRNRATAHLSGQDFSVEEWLKSLENAYSGCEDMTALAEEQKKHMLPQKGKVPEAAWKRAIEMTQANLNRINSTEK